MKNTLLAKTLTASLPGKPEALFALIADPDNLSAWHSSFCRSLRKENGALIVESPRGSLRVRFVRDDRSLVLDIAVQTGEGVELINAIRVMSNGEGSELVWTLVKPEGLSDSAFNEQIRWAGSALHALRKTPVAEPAPITAVPVASTAVEILEPLQTPSLAEVVAMPLSGRKLFVGNLPYDWTDEQLRTHFAESGTVTTAEIARFRGRGGRSRGFGFVEMGTEAEAQAAIEKLHGGLAGGRQIIVRVAKSQEPRLPQDVDNAGNVSTTTDAAPQTDTAPRPRVSRPSMNRSRPDRPRRGSPSRAPDRSSPSRGGRPRPPSSGRSYSDQDFNNKSGYEIFPRRTSVSSSPSQSSTPEPSRGSAEPSPYMEDTGDIENHGNRPPRRGRRR